MLTEFGLLFGGIAALIGAVTTSIVQLVSIRREVGEVHQLVNSRLTAVLDRVDQLERTLTAADIELPDDPADK